MSSEYRFSAYWKMWTPDGVQVTFGTADNDAPEHLRLTAHYMDELRNLGYLPSAPTLDDGEKIEDVDAYVLGASSKGDPCIYLYAAAHQLQFRLATVYVERFPDLPFQVRGKKWEASAAPTREEAEKKGFLNPVPAFQIVMALQGKTEDGKERWRFDRVHGAMKPAPAAQPDSDRQFEQMPGASANRAQQQENGNQAAAAVRAKLQKMANGYNGQGKGPATDEQKQKAAANLGLLAKGDAARHALTNYLFGKASLADLTGGEAQALRDWVHVTKQGDDWLPSQQAIEDAKTVFAALNA